MIKNIFSYRSFVYMFHILFIGPLLIYFWYIYNIRKSNISNDMWYLLLVIVIVMMLFHGYKFYNIISS